MNPAYCCTDLKLHWQWPISFIQTAQWTVSFRWEINRMQKVTINLHDWQHSSIDGVLLYLAVSGTAEPLSCLKFGGSPSDGLWCSLALPSASAAWDSGFPPAPAPSESTSPCRPSWKGCRWLSAFHISNRITVKLVFTIFTHKNSDHKKLLDKDKGISLHKFKRKAN